MSKAMKLKAKINNLAKENKIPAQAVLQNYMLERLLERIALSKYKDKVILKGGMLIASMVGIDSRTTMDMDATLRGYPLSEELIRTAFTEICDIQLDDDVTILMDHIVPIRDDDEYGGYRIALISRFESIVTPLKIDLTAGDIITPEAVRFTFHSNLDDKNIEVWAYNIETVLAEKVETILRRSVLNTRTRDFYDVFIIMKTQADAVHKDIFIAALKATSEKRFSSQAINEHLQILMTIQSDPVMRQRWDRYSIEYRYANGISFDNVLKTIIKLFD
jgi:predicted nucleotidyltransferase component of viral defense system